MNGICKYPCYRYYICSTVVSYLPPPHPVREPGTPPARRRAKQHHSAFSANTIFSIAFWHASARQESISLTYLVYICGVGLNDISWLLTWTTVASGMTCLVIFLKEKIYQGASSELLSPLPSCPDPIPFVRFPPLPLCSYYPVTSCLYSTAWSETSASECLYQASASPGSIFHPRKRRTTNGTCDQQILYYNQYILLYNQDT